MPLARLRNLFGEPVALWAALQAVTSMAVAFGWLQGIGIHSQSDLAIVLVVENAAAALHIAIVTHHTLLAPIVELFKATSTLLVIYGFHISTEQTATVITVITAVFAFGHRQATSPAEPTPPQAT